MGTAQVIFVVVELPEVTAFACATRSDVTESVTERKSRSDRMRMHNRYILYYYYSSSTKCVIAGVLTGNDVTRKAKTKTKTKTKTKNNNLNSTGKKYGENEMSYHVTQVTCI